MRTDGKLINKNVYKIQKKNLPSGRLSNVWMSSYIINKEFIGAFIDLINPLYTNWNLGFEGFLLKKFSTVADKYNLYVCPTNIISDHVEDRTKSAKVRYNNL